MPSPILPSSFAAAEPLNNSQMCVRMSRFLDVPRLLKELFSWFLTPTGSISDEAKAEMATYSTPTGMLAYFASQNVGNGWLFCLEANTKVLLSDGTYLPIKEIVEKKLSVEVASWNEDTGCLVTSKVVGWSKLKAKKRDWYRVRFSAGGKHSGSSKYHVDATWNHKFWTQRGWVQTIDLTGEDRIYRRQPTLTATGREAVIGMFLGDGTVEKTGRFSIVHSPDQSNYIHFIADKLNVSVSRYSCKSSYAKIGYQECINLHLSLKTFCPELIGRLNRSPDALAKCLDEIGPLGLAHWYMDDGSLGKDSRGTVPAYRFQLHTEGYSKECIAVMQQWFTKRFNVTAKAYFRKQCNPDNCGGMQLAFSPKDSAALFAAIAPYVLDSMAYKLPDKYHVQCVLPSLNYVSLDIVEYQCDRIHVSQMKDRDLRVRYKYDITVEGTHCFFANDILVHNCDGRDVSRADYPALFQQLGTLYGAGDGSTTFGLPDGRSRSLIGAGTGAGLSNRDISTKYVGEETHLQTIAEMPAHTHTWVGPSNTNGQGGGGAANQWQTIGAPPPSTETTSSTGGGAAFNIIHPSLIGWMHIKT